MELIHQIPTKDMMLAKVTENEACEGGKLRAQSNHCRRSQTAAYALCIRENRETLSKQQLNAILKK